MSLVSPAIEAATLLPGEEGSLFPATLRERRTLGSARHLFFDAPSHGGGGPGQYLRVLLSDGATGDYSLAAPAAPGEPLELLVGQRGTGVALAALPLGEVCLLSAARGRVFQPAQSGAHELWLLGNGTGLAPLRAILLSFQRQGGQWARLFHGARDETELFFQDEFQKLPALSYQPCLSQPRATGALPRRLQEVFASELACVEEPRSPTRAFAFCGSRVLVEELKALLPELPSESLLFAEGY